MTEMSFIASEIECLCGEDAQQRLQTVNDARFADSTGEVLAVDQDRWQIAQQYEHDAWVRHNKNVADARNFEWAEQFARYADLPEDLGDVIELGAGPFTNARLIVRGRGWQSMTLLDPLIEQYRVMAHCPYRDGVFLGRPATLIASAIEDWPVTQQYDTVIMINTLHHCRDAREVFAHIRTALKRGGWLVWGEWPNETNPHEVYNAGHPITPHADTLEAFLSEFVPVYRNGWFFIGRAL